MPILEKYKDPCESFVKEIEAHIYVLLHNFTKFLYMMRSSPISPLTIDQQLLLYHVLFPNNLPSYEYVFTKDVDEDVEKIQNAMGTAIDVSFDCAGFSKTMSTALNATRSGGKVCLVGMGHNELTVPLTSAAAR